VTTEQAKDGAGHLGTGFDVVVLAGSAGALQEVLTIVERIPAQFPAAIVVNLHQAALANRETLCRLIRHRASLPVSLAEDPVLLRPGQITVVPPQSTLAAVPGDLAKVTVAPAQDWRVADTTMAMLAERYGPRCIGVVLSGRLDDAALGAREIKRAGGRVIVQQPSDAQASEMPAAVLATGSVDLVVPARRVAQSLVALAMAPGGADLLRTPRAAWAG
jgi:two-component system, chemotaxis family, protein-glutamate methylesterase/glutaminase